MIEPYSAVVVQNAVRPCTHRAELKVNLERCLELIDRCATRFSRNLGEQVRLITFPEYFLQDWRAITVPWCSEEADPLDVCIEIPGEETEMLAAKAREYALYIAAQALEIHPAFPGYFFNCGFIIDPSGDVIYKRHKAEHAGYLMYASPHDVLTRYLEVFGNGGSPTDALFPVVDTEIGRLGMCMCFEMKVPEIHRQLVANGAEVVIRPTAEMDAFTHEPHPNGLMLDRVRALENVAYYVVPHLGPALDAPWAADEWAGGSAIVAFDGAVLAKAHTTGETLIGAVIDIDRLRRVRARGANSMAPSIPWRDRRGLPLFRPELYDYLDRASYPADSWAERPYSRTEKRQLIESIGANSGTRHPMEDRDDHIR